MEEEKQETGLVDVLKDNQTEVEEGENIISQISKVATILGDKNKEIEELKKGQQRENNQKELEENLKSQIEKVASLVSDKDKEIEELKKELQSVKDEAAAKEQQLREEVLLQKQQEMDTLMDTYWYINYHLNKR